MDCRKPFKEMPSLTQLLNAGATTRKCGKLHATSLNQGIHTVNETSRRASRVNVKTNLSS